MISVARGFADSQYESTPRVDRHIKLIHFFFKMANEIFESVNGNISKSLMQFITVYSNMYKYQVLKI